MKAEIMLFHM